MSLYNSVNSDNDQLTIITNGDSWTFGSEIAAPEILEQHRQGGGHIGRYDFLEENDYYRVPRIWPTYLGKDYNARVVNLAWPADDNISILMRTMLYISSNYIEKKKSTKNLFVIVGWSSPERNSFWYQNPIDPAEHYRLRLYPHYTSNEGIIKRFWESYVTAFWHPEEYIVRHVMTVIQFENFCYRHGIKFLQFNAFYQSPEKDIDAWEDIDITNEIDKLRLHGFISHDSDKGISRQNNPENFKPLWNTVDPVRFYKKDQPDSTFKSFIEHPDHNIVPLQGWHPSPDGHKVWATELARYIKENNLL